MVPGRAERYLLRDSLSQVFNSKLGRIAILCSKCMAWHATLSRVENSAQGLSWQLNFVNASQLLRGGRCMLFYIEHKQDSWPCFGWLDHGAIYKCKNTNSLSCSQWSDDFWSWKFLSTEAGSVPTVLSLTLTHSLSLLSPGVNLIKLFGANLPMFCKPHLFQAMQQMMCMLMKR